MNKEFLEQINEKELVNFSKNTKSDLNGKVEVEKTVSDNSWMSLIIEAIPSLDTIIRNPRRFIVQEESIVPVEKAKVVTEETVRHLGQHTDLIQKVEDDGTIIPSKLLNIYREETLDLYENRFIKTLVDQLTIFVNNKLNEGSQVSEVKTKASATYKGTTKVNGEDWKVEIKLDGTSETILSDEEEIKKREEQITYIKDILSAFRGSTFIKGLQGCEPVRSPIRKTNTILKEQNFKKALGLWEYLEANLMKPMHEVVKEEKKLTNDNKMYFDAGAFLAKSGLVNTVAEEKKFESSSFAKVLNDAVFGANLSTKKIEGMLKKELNHVLKEKKEQEMSVESFFQEQVALFNSYKKKALRSIK